MHATAVDKHVLIERIFDAPRELVFRAWADEDQLRQWFAPHGCEIRRCKLDFRVGGQLHFCIYNPTVGECWTKGIYREIVEPERIVFRLAFSDAEGNLVDTGHAGLDPGWPKETEVSVTFADWQGKTKLVLRQSVSQALAERTGAYPSWLEMLDRLAEQLTAR